jgi:hypothetical protein
MWELMLCRVEAVEGGESVNMTEEGSRELIAFPGRFNKVIFAWTEMDLSVDKSLNSSIDPDELFILDLTAVRAVPQNTCAP